MYKNPKAVARTDLGRVEVKSKFDAEFRRISVTREAATQYEEFYKLIEKIHHLNKIPFLINYIDPSDNDLLPINNDDNFRRAIAIAKPLLRVIVQSRGDVPDINGYGTLTKKKNLVSKFIQGEVKPRHNVRISMPEDFRRVSAIIDVDIVPETQRRVKLMKNGSDKPLGFYIRDGTSMQVTAQGAQKVPGIFISRLVPGGLAESTGLLAVNDEVMEVNGIEVAGKTLDQVTDMMVANSSNLIITVKPANQKNNLRPRGGPGGQSQKSMVSLQSSLTTGSDEIKEVEEDEDEVKDHLDYVVTNKDSSAGDNTNLSPAEEKRPTHIDSSKTEGSNTPGETRKAEQNNIITL